MKHVKTFESNDERSEMIDKLCQMGYDKAECDAMSYEELCDCMDNEMAQEDAWNEEEMVEEGVFKKVGEFMGIKGMDRRLDDILGFRGEDFTPTNSLKLYISQGFTRERIPTNDIKTIESALRKARAVGYGLKFFKDEPELDKMEGTEEEKKLAKYFIVRGLHSIHSTSGGGHDFGSRPNISGLTDNKTYSNLKHLKSFEAFNNK